MAIIGSCGWSVAITFGRRTPPAGRRLSRTPTPENVSVLLLASPTMVVFGSRSAILAVSS